MTPWPCHCNPVKGTADALASFYLEPYDPLSKESQPHHQVRRQLYAQNPRPETLFLEAER